MNAKPWYQSKTLWVNLGLGLLDVAQQSGLVNALPPQYLAGGAALANILLRFLTKQPVVVK